MGIGAASSRTTTYGQIEDSVKVRTNGIDNPFLGSDLMLKEISLSVAKAKTLLGPALVPFLTTTTTSMVITGSASPYIIDISGLTPFPSRILRLVHIAAGVRTPVKIVNQEEAERMLALTTTHATSVWGVWEGDVIRLYKGSGFTITITTDTTELKYVRTPQVGTVSAGTVIKDAAFTATGTVVTSWGDSTVLPSHVGGTLVGLDQSAVPFARAITSYVSATSFTIDSAVTNPTACTNGYIIPQNSVAITRGTYVDIADDYVPIVVLDMVGKIVKYQAQGKADQGIDAELTALINAALQGFVGAEQMKEK